MSIKMRAVVREFCVADKADNITVQGFGNFGKKKRLSVAIYLIFYTITKQA